MLTPWTAVPIGWLAIIVMMTALWIFQKRHGDAGVVDIAWAGGVAGIGVLYFFAVDTSMLRKMLVMIVALSWSIRLGWYVAVRATRLPKDGRYEALKKQWGPAAEIRMFRFYQSQGIGCVLFSIPILIAMLNPNPVGVLDYLALLVGVIAVIGEGLSDWQLLRFRLNPSNRGEVCQEGFWKYSRHPNYFFEWLHWWAYVLFAITYPMGWWTVVGPIAMFFFITRVTGIPHTERQALKSRGDRYREYQRATNAFFPWFPKPNALSSEQANGSLT